jgi:hypothetical protein
MIPYSQLRGTFRSASRAALPVLSLLALAPLAVAQVGPAPTPGPVPPATPTPVPQPQPVAPTPAPKDPRQTDTPGQAQPGTGATPAPTPTPTGTPAPKTVEELTKGFDKTEGLFTTYRKVENNRQKWLAEVKESQVGPLFMMQSTFASGNSGQAESGRPATDLLWRFEKTPDDRLILSTPNTWFRSSDPNAKKAIERDFPEGNLAVFTPLARNKERGTILIDFSPLFDGSITGLSTAFQSSGLSIFGPSTSYNLDPELSFIEKLKNFPNNIVVESRYHFKRSGPGGVGLSGTQADGRSLPVRVTYNLYPLTDSGYRPRLADPRVGFFINGQLSEGRTGFETFDDDASSDPRVLYINRWNLQKKDPSAKLSEPVKPITFYLDNSIPVAYRGAVRNGILAWNTAFEPLGFKGAVQVKDAPLNDWDTADMRYNTIRWVAVPPSQGGASAVALLRENPLTGEIINAGINVNSNWVRVAFQEKLEVVNPQEDVRKGTKHEHAPGIACELTGEMVENAALGYEASQVLGPAIDNKAYTNQLLRAVVAHEFGHVLGLRHNFVASTFLTPKELSNAGVVKAKGGVTASLMDYVGFNAFGLKTGAPLFNWGPAKYDRWAIAYGYTPVDAKSPKAEKASLVPIVARTHEPGLAFQTDDLADNLDPTIVRYDLSRDPLAYADRTLRVNRELLRTLGKRHPKKGETYASFTRRLRGLLRSPAGPAGQAARYIGGVINRREVRGDKGESAAFRPVPLDQQRRALDLISRAVFAPNAFSFPKEYLSKTAPDPYDFSDLGAASGYPFRDDIASVRANVLGSLFSPTRLGRMANMSWKFPGQTMELPELFTHVRKDVWGNLSPKTVVTAEQRDTQRVHLQVLTDFVTEKTDVNNDAKVIAAGELQALKKALAAPRKSSPDAMTRLFFADALRKINAALTKKAD